MSVDAASGCGNGPGSTRTTSCPRFFNSIAAVTPLIPAPTTMILGMLQTAHVEAALVSSADLAIWDNASRTWSPPSVGLYLVSLRREAKIRQRGLGQYLLCYVSLR